MVLYEICAEKFARAVAAPVSSPKRGRSFPFGAVLPAPVQPFGIARRCSAPGTGLHKLPPVVGCFAGGLAVTLLRGVAALTILHASKWVQSVCGRSAVLLSDFSALCGLLACLSATHLIFL
jgi:hypothetical protein